MDFSKNNIFATENLKAKIFFKNNSEFLENLSNEIGVYPFFFLKNKLPRKKKLKYSWKKLRRKNSSINLSRIFYEKNSCKNNELVSIICKAQ